MAGAAFSDSVLAVFVAGAAFGDSVLAVFVNFFSSSLQLLTDYAAEQYRKKTSVQKLRLLFSP